MRQSNIELLRIIIMFMVMCIHTTLAIQYPDMEFATSGELFVIGAIKAFSLVAVNVFIMISGWFGIKFTFRGLYCYMVQVLFFTLFCYAISLVFSIQQFSFRGLVTEGFMLGSRNYWFVRCYLLLYILSPVLNIFCEYVSRAKFKAFLVVFFTSQCLFSWVFPTLIEEYNQGLSTISFLGLYLLARYIRLHNPNISKYSIKLDLLIYSILSLSLSAIAYFSHGGIVSMIGFFSYSSPFVIIASLYLLLAFTKFHFYNKVINWIASSTFAVYLLHENTSIVTSYRNCLYMSYLNDNQIYKWGGVICTMLMAYVVAILLDKVRLSLLSTFKRKK